MSKKRISKNPNIFFEKTLVLSESVKNKIDKKPINTEDGVVLVAFKNSREFENKEQSKKMTNENSANIRRCQNYARCNGKGNIDNSKQKHYVTKNCPIEIMNKKKLLITMSSDPDSVLVSDDKTQRENYFTNLEPVATSSNSFEQLVKFDEYERVKMLENEYQSVPGNDIPESNSVIIISDVVEKATNFDFLKYEPNDNSSKNFELVGKVIEFGPENMLNHKFQSLPQNDLPESNSDTVFFVDNDSSEAPTNYMSKFQLKSTSSNSFEPLVKFDEYENVKMLENEYQSVPGNDISESNSVIIIDSVTDEATNNYMSKFQLKSTSSNSIEPLGKFDEYGRVEMLENEYQSVPGNDIPETNSDTVFFVDNDSSEATTNYMSKFEPKVSSIKTFEPLVKFDEYGRVEMLENEYQSFSDNHNGNEIPESNSIIIIDDVSEKGTNSDLKKYEPEKFFNELNESHFASIYHPRSEIEPDSDLINELQVSLNVCPAVLRTKNILKTFSLNFEKNILSFDDLEIDKFYKNDKYHSNINFQSETLIQSLIEENNLLKNTYQPCLEKLNKNIEKLETKMVEKEDEIILLNQRNNSIQNELDKMRNEKIMSPEDDKNTKRKCPLFKKCSGFGNSKSGNKHLVLENCPLFGKIINGCENDKDNKCVQIVNNQELEQLKKKCFEVEMENLELKNKQVFERNNLIEKLESKDRELDDVKSKHNMLLSSIEEPKKKYNDLKIQFERLHTEYNLTFDKLSEKEKELTKCNKETNSAFNSNQGMLAEKQKMIQSLTQQLEDAKSKINEPKIQVENLRTSLESLKMNYQYLTKKLESKDRELDDVKSKHNMLLSSIEEPKKKYNDLKIQFERLHTEYNLTFDKLSEKEKELTKCNKETNSAFNSNQGMLAEKQKMIQSLTQQLEDAKSKINEPKIQVENLRTSLESLKMNYQYLTKKLESKDRELDDVKSKHNMLLSSIEEPKKKYNDLKIQFERLHTEYNLTFDKLSEKEKELTKCNKETNSAFNSNQGMLAEKQKMIQSLTQQLEDAKSKINEPKIQVENLRTSLESLKMNYQYLTKKLESKDRELDDVKSKHNMLLSSIEEPKKKYNDLKIQFERLHTEYNLTVVKLRDSEINNNKIRHELQILNHAQLKLDTCSRTELSNLKNSFDIEYDKMINCGLVEIKNRESQIEMLKWRLNEYEKSSSIYTETHVKKILPLGSKYCPLCGNEFLNDHGVKVHFGHSHKCEKCKISVLKCRC